MGEEVVLEEYTDDEFVEESLASIQYPCIFIEGLTNTYEIKYFSERLCDESLSYPLYCTVEGVPFKIGNFEMSLNSLLTVRRIFGYKINLHKSKDSIVNIDLDSPETLMKFIKLGSA